MPTHAPADSAAQQRRVYAQRYAHLRKLHDFFRYDGRYRLLLMEELFRKFELPFERQRVFELGFGTGSLLFRFDVTSELHGCELSESAVQAAAHDARTPSYRDARFVLSEGDGRPRFPGTNYDIVIASHVLEH